MEKMSNVQHRTSNFERLSPATSVSKAVRGWALALLLTAAAISAHAAPVLPTEQGATWEYEVRDSSTPAAPPAALTVRIDGIEQIGGKELLKFETVAEDVVTKTELMSVDERGLHCHQRAGADGKATILDPPQTAVPWPLKIGVTWQVNDHVAGGGTQQFTVAGEEDVAVPAGTFRAFRLHCDQPWPISTATDRWFVPGTGIVKDVTTTRGPTGRLLSRATTVLKKFSVAAQRADDTPPSITIEAGPKDAPAQPPPVATPTAKPAVLLEVTGERDGTPQTEFKSDARQIFVRWSGVNLPVGAILRVTWIAEDVGEVAPANFVIDEMETELETAEFGARFTLSRPTDGWAAGKYRVEVSLGEEVLQKLSVTIAD